MADEIDFPYGLPIGYVDGRPVEANLTFWDNLIRLLNRTGGSGANFIADAMAAAAAAESTADGKITSVWQNDPPTVADFNEGDLWFDTNDGNKCYQLRSGAWVNAQDSAIGTAISAAAGAQATADTKIVTYYQTSAPATGLVVGDLWHDTDDTQRRTYRWSGSAWQNIADQTPYNTAAALAGQGPGATAAAADVLNALLASSGVNLMRNSRFRNGTTGLDGWFVYWYASSTGPTFSRQSSGEDYFLRYSATGSDASAQAFASLGIGGGGHVVPVVAGATYAVGVRLRAKSGVVSYIDAYLRFLKADLSLCTNWAPTHSSFTDAPNFADTAGEYSWQYVAAPSDAAYAYWEVYIQKSSAGVTGAGACDIDRPSVMRIPANQTVAPQWNSGFEGVIGADVTAANTAAGYTGQTAWGTANPLNVNGGVSGAFTANPITSSTSTSISMAAVTWSNPFTSVSLPSATISGLSSSTRYYVFRDLVAAAYIATSAFSTATAYYNDNTGRYLACGFVTTPSSGGGSGGGGGGGGSFP